MLKGLFGKQQQKIKGEIGFLKLEDCWINILTEDEKRFLLNNVRYLGSDKSTRYNLLESNIASSSLTVMKFVSSMLTYIKNKEELGLAKKLFDVAVENAILDDDNAFGMHLILGQMGDIYYKSRDEDENLSLAIGFYNKQIAMSKVAANSWKRECNKIGDTSGKMPSHRGYTQMAIILEKQKHYKEAYELCKKAKSEEWNGDWDKRIERLNKKIKS